MAVVSDGFFISITVMDNGGQETTRQYKLQGATQEDAETDAPLVLAAFLALTDAVLVRWHFFEDRINDALAYPASGVQNQDQALLDFIITDNPTKHATNSIPAAKPGIFVATTGPNADVVDLADAAVVTWAGYFAPASKLYISDGETADMLFKGKRRHVRSRVG